MDINILLAIVIGAVASFLFIFRQQQQRVAGHVGQLAPQSKKAKKTLQKYTREEVAKHNKYEDAWIIVKDKQSGEHKVYDVSAYVDEHPGGPSILNNVGKDATEGFLGPQHPATVFVMVEDFLIGTLVEEQ